MRPSNLLFILSDQHNKNGLGCYGGPGLTPNLDALANKSTVFTSHFTGIVPCGPARTTMLTGLYPFIHRSVTNGAPLDKRFTNIAKEVRKIGYEPDLYGYTDTSWDPRYLNEKDETREFEFKYASLGFPVISNSSANRGTDDVPMIIPEINPHHSDIIPIQQKNRNLPKSGFVAVKPNCSVQSYLVTLFALIEAGFPVEDDVTKPAHTVVFSFPFFPYSGQYLVTFSCAFKSPLSIKR